MHDRRYFSRRLLTSCQGAAHFRAPDAPPIRDIGAMKQTLQQAGHWPRSGAPPGTRRARARRAGRAPRGAAGWAPAARWARRRSPAAAGAPGTCAGWLQPAPPTAPATSAAAAGPPGAPPPAGPRPTRAARACAPPPCWAQHGTCGARQPANSGAAVPARHCRCVAAVSQSMGFWQCTQADCKRGSRPA